MNEAQQEKRVIYSELKALAMTNFGRSMEVRAEIAEDINNNIDRLNQLEEQIDYSRYKTEKIFTPSRHRQYYRAETVYSRLTSLVARLEVELDLNKNNNDKPSPSHTDSSPVVIHINQTQQNSQEQHVQISIIPIASLIENEDNQELKDLLIEMKDAIDRGQKERVPLLLKRIGEMSWELLIKVLPYLLDQWAKQNS